MIQGRYHEYHEGNHEEDRTMLERGCPAGPLKKAASRLALCMEKQPPFPAGAAGPSGLREQQAWLGAAGPGMRAALGGPVCLEPKARGTALDITLPSGAQAHRASTGHSKG